MHSPHLENEVPWQLSLSRWLAAITSVGALFGLGKFMWREELAQRRIRKLKNHTIICGMSSKGRAVALQLRANGESLVVIEKSPSPALLEFCRENHLPVLAGDAADAGILRVAGIERAARLIALCPDDSTNCEIAAQAQKIRTDAKLGKPFECRVQVGNHEARETLQRLFYPDSKASSTILHFVDSFDPEARELLVRGFPLDHDGIRPGDARRPHLVILGFGRMGRTLAVRAAQLGVFANGARLKISVLDRHADRQRDELFFRHPFIGELCDFEFHNHEATSPESRALLQKWCGAAEMLVSLAVCFDHEQLALEISEQLRQMAHGNNVRVAIRLSESSGLMQLLVQSKPDSLNQRIFGTTSRTTVRSILGEDPDEMLARRIHEAYRRMRRAEPGMTPAKEAGDKSMRDWSEILDDLRESNRQQAAHIPIKLRALGLSREQGAAGFDAKQIEILSEMEHRRWMAERRTANWSYGAKKDVTRRENPNLVGWKDLAESIREFDRVAVLAIPGYLGVEDQANL